MTLKYTHCGKQVLRHRVGFADCKNEQAAARICFLLNLFGFFEFDTFAQLTGFKPKGTIS